MVNKGKLYLIPSPLAEGPVEMVIPEGTLAVIRRLRYFIVEEIRTARRFLIKAGITCPVDELTFLVFNEHSDLANLNQFLAAAGEGLDIGLLSEAGVPCVADPGNLLVAAAHELGISVVPLTGPSSILLALMASGFNGQHFSFLGYLPSDKVLRVKKIREIERTVRERDQTQIFIETPYRNLQMLESLVSVCQENTRLCIACDVTGANEFIATKTIGAWKKAKPDINKRPAIFLLYY
ncbi:MAG: SAM-dependent methyltransferase [Bacteroidota bacterium]